MLWALETLTRGFSIGIPCQSQEIQTTWSLDQLSHAAFYTRQAFTPVVGSGLLFFSICHGRHTRGPWTGLSLFLYGFGFYSLHGAEPAEVCYMYKIYKINALESASYCEARVSVNNFKL
jgi:hypothetical protein